MNKLLAQALRRFVAAGLIAGFFPVGFSAEKDSGSGSTAAWAAAASNPSLRAKASELKALRASLKAADEAARSSRGATATASGDAKGPQAPALEEHLQQAEQRRQRRRAAELTAELRAALFPDNAVARHALQAELAQTASREERTAVIERYQAVQAALAKEEGEAFEAFINS